MVYTLPVWLNDQIQAKGWSIREVARRVGVSHTTIVKLANGQTRPSPALCHELARVFGVTVEDVYRMSGILPQTPREELDVTGLHARLDAMDPTARQAAVSIIIGILDYWDRRAAEVAQARPERFRSGRSAYDTARDTTSRADRLAQFRAAFAALSEEDREEFLAEARPSSGGTVARTDDPEP